LDCQHIPLTFLRLLPAQFRGPAQLPFLENLHPLPVFLPTPNLICISIYFTAFQFSLIVSCSYLQSNKRHTGSINNLNNEGGLFVDFTSFNSFRSINSKALQQASMAGMHSSNSLCISMETILTSSDFSCALKWLSEWRNLKYLNSYL
jgi:hypothetical protein